MKTKVKYVLIFSSIFTVSTPSNLLAASAGEINKLISNFYSKNVNNFELSCVYAHKKLNIYNVYYINVASYFNLAAYIKDKTANIENIELGPQMAMQYCYSFWSNKINSETNTYIKYLYESATKIISAESLALDSSRYGSDVKEAIENHKKEIDQLEGHRAQLFDLMRQSKLIGGGN